MSRFAMRLRAAALVALAALGAPGLAGAAFLTEGNLVVYRVGTGTGALSNAATSVFVDEYTTLTGQTGPVQTFAMPTTVSGSNRRLTASGTATSEGGITYYNGRVAVTAYDANVGTTGIAATVNGGATPVNRVVGVISRDGIVDTSTAFTPPVGSNGAYSGNNIRSAVTDGTNVWAVGAGGAVGGLYTTPLGSTGTGTQVSTSVTNLRYVNIFNGQLYTSSASGAFRMSSVGTGLPISSGQTITNLPGLPTSTGSPYGFFFADLDGTAGLDTLYLANDDANGIQKYSLVGTSWVLNGTLGVAADAFRGLTGAVDSNGVVRLYAIRAASSIVAITDTNGYNANYSSTSFTTLATAGTNQAFRGIAFITPAPVPEPSSIALFGIALAGLGVWRIRRRRTA